MGVLSPGTMGDTAVAIWVAKSQGRQLGGTSAWEARVADFGLSPTVPLQELWAQTCCFWEYLVQTDDTESLRPTLLLAV